MTVSTQVSSISHIGNGVLTQFNIPFKFLSNDDIRVSLVVIATGAATILAPSQYTISGAGNENGGTLTYSPAIAATHKLFIERVMAVTQDLDLQRTGGFFPETVEEQLDRIVMMIQMLQGQIAQLTDSEVASITQSVAGPGSSVVGNIPTFANGTGSLLGDSGFDPTDFALASHTHPSDWTQKIKAANLTRTSSTTLVSDADLTFSMAANTTYVIEAVLFINSQSESGFRVGVTGPASPTRVQGTLTDVDQSGNLASGGFNSYTTVRANTPAGDEDVVVTIRLRIENGSNTGTFAIQFAQNASNAVAATLYKGSYLRYTVV